MTRIFKCGLVLVLWAVSAFGLAALGSTQDTNPASQGRGSATTVPVTAGQKLTVEGVILEQQAEGLLVRSPGGGVYRVKFADGFQIKEKKSNLFRGAKVYARKDLIPGLHVEAKGVGDGSGSLAAKEIRFRHDDLKAAQTTDTRVVPVENELKETQKRLGETEQNAQRLSGQIQEVSALSAAARENAKTAQASADSAMMAANDAKALADTAKAGVRAANDRIASLDDYEVKSTATVHFKAGSAVISKEDQAELDKIAELAKNEKGFLIEVAGFASADGDEEYNRRLSRSRADAVIQFLAENHSIPLRRFIVPMGYGEKHPVADNQTREGRKENRRVEVRILASKGLAAAEGAVQ
jgi:outer membrane protein OmpA-like peptidoglycan-associated protein